MFKILLGFLPWILYLVLVGTTRQQHEIAILSALIATLVLDFPELKKGFVLSWGTIIFFAGLLSATFFSSSNWLEIHAYLLANSALATIAWISLFINLPFTLQYARERVPAKFWHTLLFIRINRIITSAWALAFTLTGLLNILNIHGFISGGWLYQTSTYIPGFIAIFFTSRFPDWYKQFFINRQIKKSEKSNPFLSGNFAPIGDELETDNLIIEGKIPEDLNGMYVRNGSNPQFKPYSYTYPFDGDGMLHAIYLSKGQARYKNRYIVTKQLEVDRRFGMSMYGGVNFPFIRDVKLLKPSDPQMPVKIGRFIHIIRHAGSYLALHETTSAYEVDAQLNTIGEWNPTQANEPLELNAHTRLDPKTGELFTISYHEDPFISYNVFDKNGKLTHSGKINLEQSIMIHDFVLTQNHVVIFLCPVVVNYIAATEDKQFGNWQPELKTRVLLLPRGNLNAYSQLEMEPFFAYHYANAYENKNEIIVDYVRYAKFSMNLNDMGPANLYRTSINLIDKTCSSKKLDTLAIEFPRTNEAVNSLAYRYIYAAISTEKLDNFNGLIKYDLENNTRQIQNLGNEYDFGEAVFASKLNSEKEDEGYVMLFAYHKTKKQSHFLILDAQDISAQPLATVILPRRVPNGLHGSWLPGGTP